MPKPKPSCCNNNPKKPSIVCPAGSTFKAINPVTSKIAKGSFAPDSSSNVACTRSLSLTPPLRNSENTAAASVEPTMAAINKPSRQSTSSSQVTNIPSIITVASTPQVAKVIAGLRPTRNDLKDVRSPPSNKIQARAACPTKLASPYWANSIPKIPSSPANIPTIKNNNNKGTPKRADNVLAIILAKINNAPTR